ncbi:MAG: Ig-like domain-containing protein, partial [Actinomycetia bacterium]|nr:Ig-like domain-containing protein [Actinomycetes bacterium]
MNVEDENAIDDFQATADDEFETATVTVAVDDGRLTVDAIGGNNTKINYLEVDSADEPDTEPPAAPTGLSATASGQAVELSWDANGEDDLAGYNVYRGESSDVSTDGDPLNGDVLTGTSFTDESVSPGTQYFYAVVAVDEGGNVSEPSDVADATTEDVPEVHEKYSFTTTEDESVPDGYTKNDGSAWADADGIGWVTQSSLDTAEHEPLDLTGNTRVRAARTGVSELQRRLIHLQYGDVEPPGTNGELTAGAFEREVPDGWYKVKVSVGDEEGGAGYDSQHTINVEGETAIDEFQADSNDEFDEATVTVSVTDGRLTVDAIGGTNTKLNYLELDSTDEPTEPDVHQKVRFADEASAPPSGYLKDFGQAYGERTGANQGDGLSYGWLELGTDDPASLVGNGRNRVTQGQAPASTPDLLAGLMHMQLPPNGASGVQTPGYWEMAVPDGTYDVEVSVGDAGPTVDSEHWINLEGQNAIAAFVPTGGAGSATHHAAAERTVTVTDGRLTVSPESGTNTKINWVTLDSVPGSNDRPSVLKTTPSNLATGLPPASTSVVADLDLVGGGVDPGSLSTNSVRLTNVSNGNEVAGNVLTSGGADTINFSPTDALAANTLYRLQITDGVEDVDGNAFLPYSMVFATGG